MSIFVNRLPDADKNIETVKTNVIEAVVDVFKRLRHVDAEEKEKPKRKIKITVDPGKVFFQRIFIKLSLFLQLLSLLDKCIEKATSGEYKLLC